MCFLDGSFGIKLHFNYDFYIYLFRSTRPSFPVLLWSALKALFPQVSSFASSPNIHKLYKNSPSFLVVPYPYFLVLFF